jgi:predicted phage baseplate assembly protein
VAARHAATVRNEQLGTSVGIPGSSYSLAHRPVLALEEGETLEVRERGGDGWVPWQHVDTFAQSAPGEHHFKLELSSGEVHFGPAIRQPDGGWRHYGATPPAGALMRFSRYRHGGGRGGNVAPRTVSLMLQPIPGIAGVTNPRAASGGIDAESLDSARERARLEVRSRTRTVTAEDFERLTLAASPDVARAVCVAPGDGAIRVHVLPRVAPADRRLELAELTPGEELMRTLAETLDGRRLIGTSIRLLPVRLRGVSVVVDVRASPLADLERVQLDVEHALYVYLNPLIGGSPTGPGDGWPFGRALNQGELFGIVYAISGVEFVNIVRMYETDVRTGEQAAQPTDSHLKLEPDELIVSGKHIVKAAHRE